MFNVTGKNPVNNSMQIRNYYKILFILGATCKTVQPLSWAMATLSQYQQPCVMSYQQRKYEIPINLISQQLTPSQHIAWSCFAQTTHIEATVTTDKTNHTIIESLNIRRKTFLPYMVNYTQCLHMIISKTTLQGQILRPATWTEHELFDGFTFKYEHAIDPPFTTWIPLSKFDATTFLTSTYLTESNTYLFPRQDFFIQMTPVIKDPISHYLLWTPNFISHNPPTKPCSTDANYCEFHKGILLFQHQINNTELRQKMPFVQQQASCQTYTNLIHCPELQLLISDMNQTPSCGLSQGFVKLTLEPNLDKSRKKQTSFTTNLTTFLNNINVGSSQVIQAVLLT